MHTRFSRPALLGMLVVLVLALGACGGSSQREKTGSKSERAREAQELKSGHRTLFESDRRPDHTPAVEDVMDRAYPRSYVETKRALAGRSAVTRAKARSARARARAHVRAVTASWAEAGPTTPTVPARVTYTGRATTNSGRVTAMAIDPNCGRPARAAGCGWPPPAAASGAPTTRWPHADLGGLVSGTGLQPIGSLIVDPNDHPATRSTPAPASPTVERLRGRRSASTGRTDGGDHWTLVPGQPGRRQRPLDRRDPVDPTNPSTIWIGTDVGRHGASSSQRRPLHAARTPRRSASTSRPTAARRFTLAFSRPPTRLDPPAAASTGSSGGVNKIELDPSRSRDTRLRGASSAMASGAAPRTTATTRDAGVRHAQPDRTPSATAPSSRSTRIASGKTRDVRGRRLRRRGSADRRRPTERRLGRRRRCSARTSDDNGRLDEALEPTNGTPGFASYNYCQTQCDYDEFVEVDPANPDTVWLGGSMDYDELPRRPAPTRAPTAAR